MKKYIKISAALGLTICGVLYAIINPIFGSVEESPVLVIAPELLRQHVERLANTEKPRTYDNMKALNAAAAYIKSEFKKHSEYVRAQKYKVDYREYKNIICSFGPTDGERIIIGAHYDVCQNQPGADDNASGVAGILEIARLLKSQAPKLKYRIDLVAYTLEEPPYFRSEYMGSAVHAQYLKDKGIVVKAMICLEMIGYFSDEPKSQQYPIGLLKLFYPSRGNFITIVGKLGKGGLTRKMKRGMRAGSSIDVRSISAPKIIPGIDYSDHLNYWKHGYDAVMITNTSWYRNANYHMPTDTPETLDYVRMAEVVKGVYWAVVNLK
ncbi:MAG: M28 family peptidase [Flavobacteriales bacterium]|nr:M28 family peptidase [Flavobacteriales bacterium]